MVNTIISIQPVADVFNVPQWVIPLYQIFTYHTYKFIISYVIYTNTHIQYIL